MNVDVKHHRHFVARQGKVLTEVIEDFGGVSISFPRYNSGSERVVLKGASNCVEGAKERILEIVKDLESMTTIEVEIPQKHHRSLMGAKGATVQGSFYAESNFYLLKCLHVCPEILAKYC